MKPVLAAGRNKDGGGPALLGLGGLSCFDVKSFVASLALLTLLMALWQLHPYQPLVLLPAARSSSSSSSSCPLLPRLPTAAVAVSTAAAANSTASSDTGAPTAATVTTRPALLPAPRPRDPNKRELRPYGSAAALFVQMGAYRGGPRTFAIRFVALEEAPGSYDESRFRPPFPYDYLYCGSSLYGNLSAARMREWLAYHARFFGARSHFVLHDAGGVTPEVRAVLDPWVRAGRVTVQDIRAQEEYDGYYYNQFLVVNDCLHRYRHAANWTFFFDVDEYIYLPDGRTLEQVLGPLERYTQFTIEQNPMSSKLCVDDPTEDYSREWGFEKLVFRNSITGVRRDRKYAIQARNAYSTGVHMSQNVYGRTTHKTETLIRYYHYHNSINVMGEPCRKFVPKPVNGSKVMFEGIAYVYDDKMKRLAGEIRRFEKQTIGDIHT
uniref:Glycosyltransferase family 92 protein n=1 Tax=Oryza brachyantha TaxID=4533 RepID=J3MEF2_ORYBR